MSKHTLAPWAISCRSGNDAEAFVIEAAGRPICWTADTYDEDEGEGKVTAEDKANAFLISKAPELYNLLTRIVHPMADDGDVEDAKALLQKINKAHIPRSVSTL